VKIFRATLFFRASASCSKILNDEKYLQYSGKFHGKLGFSGKGEKIFKVSCNGEHNTQGTSPPGKVTTEFSCNGTSRALDKERYCRIEVTV